MVPRDEEEARLDTLLAELKEISLATRDRRRKRIAEQIGGLERELQLIDSLPSSENGRSGTTVQIGMAIEQNEAAPITPATSKPPTKPQGMLMVLAEQPARSWKLAEIREAMVGHGWLPPGSQGAHQIQNVALKLKKRGDVTSPRNAYYRITQRGLEAVG